MGTECYTEAVGENLYALSACGNGKRAFVIVNDSECEREVELTLKGAKIGQGQVMAVDEEHTFDEIAPLDEAFVLPPYAIRYVEF